MLLLALVADISAATSPPTGPLWEVRESTGPSTDPDCVIPSDSTCINDGRGACVERSERESVTTPVSLAKCRSARFVCCADRCSIFADGP